MTSSPGTPPDANLTTILAVDIGTTRTKAALFTRSADGHWTCRGSAEALTTVQSPREGMMGGLLTAARELEQKADHPLVAADGSLLLATGGQRGADALLASSSAAAPLSLMCLGATTAHSGAWARVASQWSHAQIIDEATLDAGLDTGHRVRWSDASHQRGEADVATRIRALSPDAVLVVGGYDGGAAAPLLEMAKLVAAARPPNRPPLTVVYAGNASAARRVAAILAGRAEVRIVDNVLPAPNKPQPAPAGEAIDELYCQRKLAAMAGHDVLTRLCSLPVLSAARALALAWSSMAQMHGAPVLGLDIGAHATVIGSATPDGDYGLRVHADLGVGYGWDSALHDIDSAAIGRWLPIPFSKTEIQTRLAARRDTIAAPESADALLFQEALTREAWRRVLWTESPYVQPPTADVAPFHIVGSGGVVAHTPSLWRVALMLLDAVELRGLAYLWADRAGVLAQMGTVAGLDPAIAQALFAGNTLCRFGLAVALDGATMPGSKAADVELTMPDGSLRRTIAAWGSVHLLPTGGLSDVKVSVRPVRGVYIPGHEGESSVSIGMAGGELGVILDCRGRPLAAQLAQGHSHARMRAWLAAGDQDATALTEHQPIQLRREIWT